MKETSSGALTSVVVLSGSSMLGRNKVEKLLTEDAPSVVDGEEVEVGQEIPWDTEMTAERENISKFDISQVIG